MKTKQSNLELFNNGFSKALENAGKERVSNNNLAKHLRRLDSIARLFEGDAICTDLL